MIRKVYNTRSHGEASPLTTDQLEPALRRTANQARSVERENGRKIAEAKADNDKWKYKATIFLVIFLFFTIFYFRQARQVERQAHLITIREKNELRVKLEEIQTRVLKEKQHKEKEECKKIEINQKAAKAEKARHLAKKKADEALHLEEELLIAQQGLEEHLLLRNLLSVVSNSSNSSINQNNSNNNHINHVTSSSSTVSSLSNNHSDENDEDDVSKEENDIELRLNESLSPEQYRETAFDKNQKIKQ